SPVAWRTSSTAAATRSSTCCSRTARACMCVAPSLRISASMSAWPSPRTGCSSTRPDEGPRGAARGTRRAAGGGALHLPVRLWALAFLPAAEGRLACELRAVLQLRSALADDRHHAQARHTGDADQRRLCPADRVSDAYALA